MNIFIVIMLIISGGTFVLNLLWSLFLAFNPFIRQEQYKDYLRPFNTMLLLIPAMNEYDALNKNIQKWLDLQDQCKDFINLKFVFIDDDSDDGTSELLDEFAHLKDIFVVHRVKPNAQQGKGPALQDAVERIAHLVDDDSQTIIGIVDADARFSSEYLHSVWQTFQNSTYDLVQTRVKIYNTDNGLAIMQNFEFTIYNGLLQMIRTRWGSALASGNGQFVTMEMAKEVGWRSSLLEDCEFSLNGLLKGFYGTFLNIDCIEQEGVTNIQKLIRQRTRWCQGGLQCLNRYGKEIIKSKEIPSILKLDIIFFLMIPYMSVIIAPAAIVSLIVLIYYALHYFWTSFIIICVILIIDALSNIFLVIKQWQEAKLKASFNLSKIIKALINIAPYRWVMAIIPYKAIVRMIMGNNSWAKTKHT